MDLLAQTIAPGQRMDLHVLAVTWLSAGWRSTSNHSQRLHVNEACKLNAASHTELEHVAYSKFSGNINNGRSDTDLLDTIKIPTFWEPHVVSRIWDTLLYESNNSKFCIQIPNFLLPRQQESIGSKFEWQPLNWPTPKTPTLVKNMGFISCIKSHSQMIFSVYIKGKSQACRKS